MRIIYVVILIVMLCSCSSNKEDWHSVTKEDIDIELSASGVLSSVEVTTVGPPMIENHWSYKINYMIAEGTIVKEGQKILSFDISEFNQKLAEKESAKSEAEKGYEAKMLDADAQTEKLKLTLAEKKMKMDKAFRKWRQAKSLSDNIEAKKLNFDYKLAELDYQQAESNLEGFIRSAKMTKSIELANIEKLSNTIKGLKNGIERLTINANRDGVISYKNDHNGDKKAVGDTVWMGRVVMEVASLDALVVKASIDEVDSQQIVLGQKVEVVIDAIPNRTFHGEISKLGQVFRPKSREIPSKVFDNTISILDPDDELMRPGMNARMKIKLKEYVDVILVPQSAVVLTDENTQVTVKGTIANEERDVTLGEEVGDKVIIEHGLHETNEVLL